MDAKPLIKSILFIGLLMIQSRLMLVLKRGQKIIQQHWRCVPGQIYSNDLYKTVFRLCLHELHIGDSIHIPIDILQGRVMTHAHITSYITIPMFAPNKSLNYIHIL